MSSDVTGNGTAGQPDDPEAAQDAASTGPASTGPASTGPAGATEPAGGLGPADGTGPASAVEPADAAEAPEEPSDEPADDGPGLPASLEAIMLVADEPVPEVLLAQVLERPRGEVAEGLRALAAEYTADG